MKDPKKGEEKDAGLLSRDGDMAIFLKESIVALPMIANQFFKFLYRC